MFDVTEFARRGLIVAYCRKYLLKVFVVVVVILVLFVLCVCLIKCIVICLLNVKFMNMCLIIFTLRSFILSFSSSSSYFKYG